MSTGNMPEPPDTPTSRSPAVPNAEDLSGAAAGTAQTAEAAPPAVLKSQMATAIEQQADVIAQRLVYNSQLTYGVSAIGVDFVNARNSALVIADALRSCRSDAAEESLVNLGDSQVHQVNDQTIPFKNN